MNQLKLTDYLKKVKEVEQLVLSRNYSTAIGIVKKYLNCGSLPSDYFQRFSDLYAEINYKLHCSNRSIDITSPLIEKLRTALTITDYNHEQLLALCMQADVINVTKIIDIIQTFLLNNQADNKCKTWLIYALYQWKDTGTVDVIKNRTKYTIDLSKGFHMYDADSSLTVAWNALSKIFFQEMGFLSASILEGYAHSTKNLQSFYLHVYPDIPLLDHANDLAAAVVCFTFNAYNYAYSLEKFLKILSVSKASVLKWLKKIESIHWS